MPPFARIVLLASLALGGACSVEFASTCSSAADCGPCSKCQNGSCVPVTPCQAAVSVRVSPSAVTLGFGAAQQFAASVEGSADQTVEWSVEEAGGGAVDGAGLYRAPSRAGVFHVVATSRADPTQHGRAAVTVEAGGPGSLWVSGYYPHWQRAAQPISRVDLTALTHLIVSSVSASADGTVVNPDPDGAGTYAWLTPIVTATHAAGRKAILAVDGGAADWRGAASDANRASFVQNLLPFVRPASLGGHGFDGLNLGWAVDFSQNDLQLALALAADLRAAAPGITLTTDAGYGDADPGHAQLASSFDQLNVWAFAMSGAYPGWVSWHHAPLFGEGADHPVSVSAAVEEFLAAGVPAARLGLGIGFYGAIWHGGAPPVTAPLQTISAGVVCERDNHAALSYATLIADYFTPAAYLFDDVAKVPTLSYPAGYGPLSATWISYEDAQSIAAKAAYVRQKGLGGAMLWTVQDGCTNPLTGENPLLAAAKDAFLGP